MALNLAIVLCHQPKIERCWGDSLTVASVKYDLESLGHSVEVVIFENGLKGILPACDVAIPNSYYLDDSYTESLPAALNYLQKRYLFFSAHDKALFNKIDTKSLLSRQCIPSPKYVIWRSESRLSVINSLGSLRKPLVIKPAVGANSIGIELRNDVDESYAPAPGADYIIEEWSKVREFTVAVIISEQSIEAFPSEVKIPAYEIFTEELKRSYMGKILAPVHDTHLLNEIRSLAEDIARKLSIRDIFRFDVVLSENGQLLVIDINLLPGLSTNVARPSLFIQSCAFFGVSRRDVLTKILKRFSN